MVTNLKEFVSVDFRWGVVFEAMIMMDAVIDVESF